MTSDQWMERDRERRETVERYHRLKDFEEDFVVAKQAAKTPEEVAAIDGLSELATMS